MLTSFGNSFFIVILVSLFGQDTYISYYKILNIHQKGKGKEKEK